jgi:hypothetical protein
MSEEIKTEDEQKDNMQLTTEHSSPPEDNPPGSEEIKTSSVETAALQTPTAPLQSLKMEVHHPHHLTHKKKWNEYLLEFLMLFLAVFLGFIAENIREHYVERHREKAYMQSLLQELKFDTTNYQRVIDDIKILNPALDSSYTNVKEAARFNNIMQGRWQSIINVGSVEYRPSLSTIQQMQSSGNLRLIEKHEVGKKISEYLAFARGSLERGNNNVGDAALKVYDFEDANCDYTNFRKSKLNDNKQENDSINFIVYSMALMEKDPIKLNQFANSFINYQSNNTGYNNHVHQAKKLATELIVLVNKEYHLEDD